MEGWATCRLVHSQQLERNNWPVVYLNHPWKSIIGWVDQQPVYTDKIDFNKISDFESPILKYSFRSTYETVFCIVGPKNESEVKNIRISWNSAVTINSISLVYEVENNGVTRVKNEILQVPLQPQEILLKLAMIYKGLPPKIPTPNGPWKVTEVRTRINKKTEHGFTLRIEHHLSTRVPPAQFWNTRGGYGARNDSILQTQSQAAICWQFATRRVLEDSGWARNLFDNYDGSFIHLMGFETNNPLHDDFYFRPFAFGPHWHIALRRDGPLPHPLPHVTPHIYISEEDGRSLRFIPDVGTSWNLGTFGIRIIDDGKLELGPLTRLKHLPSSKYLHVLHSQQEDRSPAVLFGSPNSKGSVWMLIYNEDGTVLFRNMKSRKYLHVLKSKQGEGNVVSIFSSTSEGSRWIKDPNGRLQNLRSSTYLSAPINSDDRERTEQSQSLDLANNNDVWILDPSQHNLEKSYTIQVTVATPTRAEAEIFINGIFWQRVETSDDTLNGRFEYRFFTKEEKLLHEEVIRYDSITGSIVK